MVKKESGLTKAGLVLGIIAIATSFIPVINNASIIMGILAFVFGIIGLVKKVDIKGKAIASVVLGALSVIIALSLQAQWVDDLNKLSDDLNESIDEMSGNKTEELLANNVDVTLGDFQVIKGDYFDETKLVVTIKNKSSEKATYSISIEAVDSNGDRLDDDIIYANDLNAGQSQTFEAFTYVDSSLLEQLENATFKILEISKY